MLPSWPPPARPSPPPAPSSLAPRRPPAPRQAAATWWPLPPAQSPRGSALESPASLKLWQRGRGGRAACTQACAAPARPAAAGPEAASGSVPSRGGEPCAMRLRADKPLLRPPHPPRSLASFDPTLHEPLPFSMYHTTHPTPISSIMCNGSRRRLSIRALHCPSLAPSMMARLYQPNPRVLAPRFSCVRSLTLATPASRGVGAGHASSSVLPTRPPGVSGSRGGTGSSCAVGAGAGGVTQQVRVLVCSRTRVMLFSHWF